MKDYDIIIKLECIPAENEEKALESIDNVITAVNNYENVQISVKKQGEWL